jgi:hypothetical protein
MDNGRIGADYAEAFKKANLVLVASRPSATPGVMDAELQLLERRAYMLLYAVFMSGVPNFWPGVLTMGSRRGTEAPWANRIALINDLYRHGHALPSRVTAHRLAEADTAVLGFIDVFEGGNRDYARLRRGVNALVDAWKQRSVLDRLHAFVRALDALLKLERGAGERQFVDRVAAIASGTKLDEVAREMYRLRSYTEHISDWPSKLAYVKEPDRPRFVSKRAFQVEVLAGESYRRVLSDADLRAAFADSRVDAFWQGGAGAWHGKVDLDALDQRFHYTQ